VNLLWARKATSQPSRDEDRTPVFDPDAKPDFLCVGAQKAGTTWLFEQLNWHDDFWMPPLKEVNYFDHMSRSRHPERSARSNLRVRDERDRRFLEAMENLCAQQHIDLDLYAQLFAPKGSLLSGDVSPAYCIVPEEIIARIVERFSELKVIFLARDPVERAWSDLSMAVHYGGIRSFDANDTAAIMRNLLHPDMITRSFQSTIVMRWQSHLADDRFRVYFFDDLQSDPELSRRDIVHFLGGDANKSNPKMKTARKFNETGKKLPLMDHVRAEVARFFEQELKACAMKLGGAARKWPARYGFLFLWFAQMAGECDYFALDLFGWS
jgi:hypothetical protein